LIKYTGHENKGNNHQTRNVLIFNEILPTTDIRNIERKVRRICMWILGLKGLRHNNTNDIGSDVRGDAGGNARNNAGGTADIAARGNGGMQCW